MAGEVTYVYNIFFFFCWCVYTNTYALIYWKGVYAVKRYTTRSNILPPKRTDSYMTWGVTDHMGNIPTDSIRYAVYS